MIGFMKRLATLGGMILCLPFFFAAWAVLYVFNQHEVVEKKLENFLSHL